MINVYCEQGAYRKELKSFEEEGLIKLLGFPYDDKKSRKISSFAVPSNAQIKDMNLTWDEAPGTWDDYKGSNKHSEIERIIGGDNRRDVLHFDSAYKSGCEMFLTKDKKDILSKKKALGELFGIRCFHPLEDWDSVIEYIESSGSEPEGRG